VELESGNDCEASTERWAQTCIVTSLAGAIAQERYLIEEGSLSKEDIQQRVLRGSGEDDPRNPHVDYYKAVDLADRLGGDLEATDLYFRFCKRRAQLLIERRWRDVKAVAEALLEHKTLTHQQVINTIWAEYGLAPLEL
jgi:hypothetical protein